MDKSIKSNKPWYKKWWIWVIIIIVVTSLGSVASPKETPTADTAPIPETKTTETPKEETPPVQWDMEAAYAKIENGMTKAQVEEVTGEESKDCSESQNEYIGKTEFCSYGNAFIDKGTITVTYSNDAVSNKSKHNY